jgi:deoxyribonuclease V
MEEMNRSADLHELERLQHRIARLRESTASLEPVARIGGCFVCFGRGGGGPGSDGDQGWAAAAVVAGIRCVDAVIVTGSAGAPYVPGLLAAREGPLLEHALRSLRRLPDVVLVNATGRDHPRRAGMATQLGWILNVPTVGVTHRPLVASGAWPAVGTGVAAPLRIDGEHVGWWVRTRPDARPLAVSPGWRTDVDSALDVTLRAVGAARTPEPIRLARRLAREARYQGTADRIE